MSTLIQVFAKTPNHLIIASVVGGFPGGSYFPILLSMIGDIADEEEKREGISTLFLFSGIGMVIGPSLVAFFLLSPQITLRNIYQISAITQFLALFYMQIVIKETNPPGKQEKIAIMSQIKGLITQKGLLSLLVVTFLFSLYHSIFRTYAPIYGRLILGFTDPQVVSLETYRNLGVMLIRLSFATFMTNASIPVALLVVLGLGGLTGLLVLFANNYIFVSLIVFLVGVCFGAFRILSTTIIADSSVPENRGLANSLIQFSQSTGILVKIFTSSMAESFGLIPVFLLAGATCLSAIIPTLRSKLGR